MRITIFDFSRSFNTIQPLLLRKKLELSGLDHHLTSWIMDYLTNCPQYVRTKDCVSDMTVCSTGAPQGTVLSPFLFTLYTAEFLHSYTHCHPQEFSDNSAIVGLITNADDREYRELIKNFVDWGQRNCLQINAGKTKELVVESLVSRVVCWSSSISTADRKRLDKLIRKASSALGCPFDSVQVVRERRMITKLSSMKERHRRSFLPAAVRLLNNKSK